MNEQQRQHQGKTIPSLRIYQAQARKYVLSSTEDKSKIEGWGYTRIEMWIEHLAVCAKNVHNNPLV